MNKEAIKNIYENSEDETTATERYRTIKKVEHQLAINMTSDNRIIKIYPILLELKKSKIDAIIKDKEIIVSSLSTTMSAIANAFNIVATDPLTNTGRLVFFAVVVADLTAKQIYLMLKFDETETMLQDELNKPLTEYYVELPNVNP